MLIMLAASLSGCKDVSPAPGPVPLRGDAHMREYLADVEWRLVGHGQNRWLRFAADGSFEAGGNGIGQLLGLPDDTGPVSGHWEADASSLKLSEFRIGDIPSDAPLKTLALGWVDGKLNISIAGQQYRR